MKNFIAAIIIKYRTIFILFLKSLGIFFVVFGIYSLNNPTVKIHWTTESEIDTLGFNLIRETIDDGNSTTLITTDLVFALGTPITGETYQYIDKEVKVGETYLYHLQEITNSNQKKIIDSRVVTVKYPGIQSIGIGILLIILSYFALKHQGINR